MHYRPEMLIHLNLLNFRIINITRKLIVPHSFSVSKQVDHLELQRGITLREVDPFPYSFIKSICLVDMQMFAMFDEIPAMTLQDIKERKCNEQMHREHENSIPLPLISFQGYKNINLLLLASEEKFLDLIPGHTNTFYSMWTPKAPISGHICKVIITCADPEKRALKMTG